MRTETAFWDTSAVVPLCCHQTASAEARRVAHRYGRMVVWWCTRVEAHDALTRLRREGALTTNGFQQTLARLSTLSRAWLEVLPVEEVRQRAEELLARQMIRAAAALQLAAALVWCQGNPQRRAFVCFDRRLAGAATQLGFEVGIRIRP
jgi:predicted nucleic acid-binding protein